MDRPESARLQALADYAILDTAPEEAFDRLTALAQARGDLLAMAESVAGLGHWRLDVRTRAAVWSDQMYRLYGLEPGSPIDLEAVMSMTHPDDAAAQRARLKTLTETGASEQSVIRIVLTGGGVRHLSFKSGVERDASGQIVALIGAMMDVTDQRMAELALADERALLERTLERMSHLAQHDALTGLPNRLLLDDRVRQACKTAARNHTAFAVAYLDLDGFKAVNDTFGHTAGDELLKAVARRLTGSLRASDTVCRLGGDEFVILLNGLGSAEAAASIARTLIAEVALPCPTSAGEASVSASVGIAMFPADGTDADTLMRRADSAMYRAKTSGKNQHRMFAQMAGRAAA